MTDAVWPAGPARWLIVLAAAMLPAKAEAQRTPIPFSDEAVEKAIEKAKEYLWSQYQENVGHWPEPPLPKVLTGHQYHGGYSSLALYALLEAGESYQQPRMKRALEWLATVPMNATYCLGIRTQVWLLLPRERGRELLKKDAQQLIESISRPAKPPVNYKAHPGYGSYNYLSNGTPRSGDHSNSQFGVLGVWAAARQNLEVPQWYWQLVYRHWEATQNPDGGWGYGYKYGGGGGSKGTMTAAGLASAFVAFDIIHAAKFVKCGANPVVPPIQKGLDWFDKNYSPSQSVGGGPYYYYLYGVERVGLASGYKYFGKKDWYKLGATRLINTQGAAGNWGSLVQTTFATLFLVRGRAPVLFNRLEYEGDWNNRPRALANLMRWTGRRFEREVNWQIINLKTPVEEWHDAPILLITGSKAPKFSDAELDKLREFVWQGGTILSVSECRKDSAAFDTAMRGTPAAPGFYGKLFPKYELKRLPNDHAVYSAHKPVKRPIPLWGLSNGVRLLAFHTDEDLPLPWQTNAVATGEDAFQLAFNIVYYVTDRASLRHRGTSPWPGKEPIVPLRLARVARVKYSGNWDPEPLAWERFRMLMGQHWQTRVVHEAVEIERLNSSSHRVAAMTGTTSFTLSEAEKRALKAYVEGGGTLILDSAGGSEAFSTSAVALIRELFGAGSLHRLPGFSEVYRLPGMVVEKVGYRRAARRVLSVTKLARLLGVTVGDRVGVFLSKEDLTSALVGYPCFSCVGYSPGTAAKPGSGVQLMRNMVVYGNRVRKAAAPLATQPARPG